MTILFIVFTCPSAIASQYYLKLWGTYSGRIVLFFCDDLTFAYHALNIVILCLSNKLFLRELKDIFYKNKTSSQDNTTNVFSLSHKNTNNISNMNQA